MTDAQGRKIVLNAGHSVPAMKAVKPPPAVFAVQTGDTQTWSHIHEAARTYGLDPDLVAAVIRAESNFNPNAVSRKGAQGLMQIMPGTARLLGLQDAFDGKENIKGGCRYLRSLLDDFNGDIKLALAAYNAGGDNVRKYNGIPPFPETRNYVRQVMLYYSGNDSMLFSGIRRVRVVRGDGGRVLVTNQRR
jgi:soluble lytic murein transglycosylase-like protein